MKSFAKWFFLILCLYVSLGAAQAQSCPARLQMGFADGSTACLSELPLGREKPDGWNTSLADAVRASITGLYSVARSTDPACKALAIVTTAAAHFATDAAALSACRKAGCECKVLIRNGTMQVSREEALGQAVPVAAAPATPAAPVAPAAANVPAQPTQVQAQAQAQALARAQAENEQLRAQLAQQAKPVPAVPAVAAPSPAAPVAAAASRGPARRALVIGNDSYTEVNRLENARADARAMSQALQAVGFQVTTRLDLTERAMKETLRTFKGQIQGGDEVVVYFAGHGVQIGPANFLLPVDIRGQSEEQVRDEAIPLQRLLDDLQEAKANFSLMIIDACRDNPFKGTGRAIGGRGLTPPSAASGQVVIFSAGAGQRALDRLSEADRDPNGLFTRVLLREMNKPDVAIDKVLRNVRSEVVRLAKSVGHEQVPALYDQALGDFYFRR